MRNVPLLLAAAALLVSSGIASAQGESAQKRIDAPTGLQSTTPDKPPVATLPEAATDPHGGPPQTTGQAPNVSKKMGAEMDSAGDPRASPDEQ